jgi:transposase-like protein
MSTTKNRQGGDKERFWRGLLRQWRRSGSSVRGFCREHGLSEPSFYAWRRTLAERDAALVPFVPVQVRPETQPTLAADDGAAGIVELVLKTGRCVRVRPGFDGPTLTRLLALLEEGRP